MDDTADSNSNSNSNSYIRMAKKKKSANDENPGQHQLQQLQHHQQHQQQQQVVDVRATRRHCCTQQCCCQYLRKFIFFIITRLGLMILAIGYYIAGASIFMAIEADFEQSSLRLSESVLDQMLVRIYKQIETNSTTIHDEHFYRFINEEIRSAISNHVNFNRQKNYHVMVF